MQVFFWEFCKIFKNIFFREHYRLLLLSIFNDASCFNDANSELYNIVSNPNDTSFIKENYPDFMLI